MPDKWAQYAVNPSAQPAPQDKWAQYAQPAAQPKQAVPVGGDLRPLTEKEEMSTTFPVGAKGEGFGENVHNSLRNAFTGAYQTLAHPIDTVTNMVKSVIPGTDTPNPIQSVYQGLNTRPGETLSTMAGQTAATAGLGRVAAKPLEVAGTGMQDVGAGVMNKTVGALKKDYQRGANPGRAYLDAGGGPAMSMESLAAKAEGLQDNVGSQLGSLYDNATQNGVKIPVNQVTSALRGPIQEARSVVTGPGGTGDVLPIRQFGASFAPPIQKAVAEGGFSPNDLFAVKKNVAKNTSWTDPTQVGMKSLRQQSTGAIGGTLSDYVPESKPLNAQYQGLVNLSDRAQSRALTGSSPLTHLATRTTLGAAGAMAGHAVSPLASILGGAGAMALDSVPVKSTVASTLYHGGKATAAIGKGLQGLYAPKRP